MNWTFEQRLCTRLNHTRRKSRSFVKQQQVVTCLNIPSQVIQSNPFIRSDTTGLPSVFFSRNSMEPDKIWADPTRRISLDSDWKESDNHAIGSNSPYIELTGCDFSWISWDRSNQTIGISHTKIIYMLLKCKCSSLFCSCTFATLLTQDSVRHHHHK